MRFSQIILMCFVGAFMLQMPAAAGVPHLVNYQGYLTDLAGEPITGTHDLTFSIYDDAGPGPVALWTESYSNVPVHEGIFHIILGSVTPFPQGLFEQSPLWMGIRVNGDPEIAPRMQLTSVPWAIRASVADSAMAVPGGLSDGHSLDAVDGDPTDVVFVDSEGKVGVGTTAPGNWQLNVAGGDNSFDWGGDHSGSGYMRLGNIQICWGSVEATSLASTNVDIGFPASFKDTSYSMTVLSDGEWSYVTAYSSNKLPGAWNNLTMLNYNGSYATGTATYIAIGAWQ